MFPHVVQARYESDYRIWLAFSDGTEGVVDLEPELHGPVFSPLRDIQQFRKFKVHEVAKTLVWPNGADFAPECLRSKLI